MFVCDGCGAAVGVGDVDVHSCRYNARPRRVLLVEYEVQGVEVLTLYPAADTRESASVHGHSFDMNAKIGAIVRHFSKTGSVQPPDVGAAPPPTGRFEGEF